MDFYQQIINQVANALDEDIGSGDISAQLIDSGTQLETELLVREDAILCGCQWVDEVFRQCDQNIATRWRAGDGDRITANSVVCEITGPARGILTAERSALNFLQTLSGTATVTREYADIIGHTRCKILDTRKTVMLAAEQVMTQAVLSTAMPLGNATGMTDSERAELGGWLRQQLRP